MLSITDKHRQTTLRKRKSGKPLILEKQAIYINTTKKGGLLRQFFKCCIYNNSLITLTK